MSLRDSWRIAALTRERDALLIVCAALLMALKCYTGCKIMHDGAIEREEGE